jgi:hypothetical protein
MAMKSRIVGGQYQLPAFLKRAKKQQYDLPRFMAGDVLCFAGQGDLYSRASRWLMRMEGEGPTYSVHTAQFIDGRRVLEMDMVGRIKTIEDVLAKRNNREMWKRRGFEVWRCETLTAAQRQALTRQALKYVDVHFGFAKFWAHMLDNLIYRVVRRDVMLFRRLDRSNRYPVCSGITSVAYARALNYEFGVPPETADPDQVHDWMKGHPDEWVEVFRLEEYVTPAAAASAASAVTAASAAQA